MDDLSLVDTSLSVEQRVLRIAEAAKAAATAMAMSSAKQRDDALRLAAQELHANRLAILEANVAGLKEAKQLLQREQISQAMFDRLKLDQNKLDQIIEGVNQVAALSDPLGKLLLVRELDEGLMLYQVTCPIGLIAVIFESRPDALPQIASLCIKSGNAVILKGGSEAKTINRLLFGCFQHAAEQAGLPENALSLVESREAVTALLKADRQVDLIVPRGSNELVRSIQDNTRIPVLGHAEGLCHLYIDRNADMEKAIKIAVDAKAQYPAACNSIETLLVHEAIARRFLSRAVPQLLKHNVELRCDATAMLMLAEELKDKVKPSLESDWSTEYSDLILSVKVIGSLNDAVRHINKFGSHHTDAIVTEDQKVFDKFFAQVNSAGVYWNASTRFADGFRYGFGAELGISTGKLHPRGPVGIEGLVTYKYKVVGKGHIVADYAGENARRFTHRTLDNNRST